GFHTVRIDGLAASYTISVLQGEELEPHVTVLSAQDVSLNTDAPLFRVDCWSSGEGGTVWVQADCIVFNDVTVRLTVDGAVVVQSASGDNTLVHGGSRDGASDDHLVGGAGNDILLGHDGNDVLVGGAGEDWLISNSGQDTLIGGDGNDVLMALGDPAAGPEARVEMYGGAGEDVFVIAPGIPVMSQNQDAEKIHKDVVIHDFVIGEDRIDLSRMYVMEGDIARQATIEDLCL